MHSERGRSTLQHLMAAQYSPVDAVMAASCTWSVAQHGTCCEQSCYKQSPHVTIAPAQLLQVLALVCECTQQLLHILRVNGPHLEGPLHTGLAPGTQSALLQLETQVWLLLDDKMLVLEEPPGPAPQLPPPTCTVTQLDDLWGPHTMGGGHLALTQYALSSMASNPHGYAAWSSSGVQQYTRLYQQFAGEAPCCCPLPTSTPHTCMSHAHHMYTPRPIMSSCTLLLMNTTIDSHS
jgi:hypothetical protein